MEIACASKRGTVGSNPTLSARMREISHCAFCPKLCSNVCPVSTATHRETHTPWGKQTTLW